jgi:Asp-tRNA(Asn)/Glu-tRNA(Gln) amidotransferase A subunit family amidase
MLDSYRLTVAANVLAVPAVTIPASMSQTGTPIGVQLLGPRFGDATLLEAARRIEEKIPPITPIDPH